MEQGGHRSASGRVQLEVLAGSVLTHNPGEVHDGTPIQGEGRCWVMLHVAANPMRSLGGQTSDSSATDVEFTHPVLQDPQLVGNLQRLLKMRAQRDARERDDGLTRLANESALSLLCTYMLMRRSTARLPSTAPVTCLPCFSWPHTPGASQPMPTADAGAIDKVPALLSSRQRPRC